VDHPTLVSAMALLRGATATPRPGALAANGKYHLWATPVSVYADRHIDRDLGRDVLRVFEFAVAELALIAIGGHVTYERELPKFLRDGFASNPADGVAREFGGQPTTPVAFVNADGTFVAFDVEGEREQVKLRFDPLVALIGRT
jgi:hypothetical protein